MAVVYFFQNKWYELNTTPADTTWANYFTVYESIIQQNDTF